MANSTKRNARMPGSQCVNVAATAPKDSRGDDPADLKTVSANSVDPADLKTVSANSVDPADLKTVSANSEDPADLKTVSASSVDPADLKTVFASSVDPAGWRDAHHLSSRKCSTNSTRMATVL